MDGLFREGETVNIIASPKVGKSWLAYKLALSIIAGQDFLGFATARGKVLLIDNELHPQTLALRIPAVANPLGIFPAEYNDDLEVWPLRGNLRPLHQLEDDLEAIEPGHFKAIILDAKYRFGNGDSENDNAAETQFYNTLDRIAERTGAALVLIHHSTKGSQSDKRLPTLAQERAHNPARQIAMSSSVSTRKRASLCSMLRYEVSPPSNP